MDLLTAYYKETESEKRARLLSEIEGSLIDIELIRLLKQISLRRYGKRQGEQDGVDYFIRSLVVIQGYSKGLGAMFRGGAVKIGKSICHDLFLDDIEQFGEEGQMLLYQEFLNCARLYHQLCLKDKQYGSKWFGLRSMSNEERIKKEWAELELIKKKSMKNLKLEKPLKMFVAAFYEAAAETT